MTTSCNTAILQAAKALKEGDLVVFPTETVYGLGASAYDARAIAKIYALKGRPATNPLIVHVACSADIAKVIKLDNPQVVRRLELLAPCWPGPLTVVSNKHDKIPDVVTAGLPTVGVRVPAHPVAHKLLELAAIPVAAPSANKSTAISPTLLEHARQSFGNSVTWYLEGGPCTIGLESTILLISTPEPRVLRPGVITREQLQDILREKIAVHHETGAGPALAPGQALLHYAPVTPVAFWTTDDPDRLPHRIGLISFYPIDLRVFEGKYVVHKELGSGEAVTDEALRLAASRLYVTLHELDALGLDLILVTPCLREGIGEALMDRLSRAAAKGRI